MPIQSSVIDLYKFKKELIAEIYSNHNHMVGGKEKAKSIVRTINETLERFIDPSSTPKKAYALKCGKDGCRGGHKWVEQFKVDSFNCSSQ